MEDKPTKILKPVNQKSVYNSFALVYEKLMNDEIPVEKAEQACNALGGMNRAFALEIKFAELAKTMQPRTIETIAITEGESRV